MTPTESMVSSLSGTSPLREKMKRVYDGRYYNIRLYYRSISFFESMTLKRVETVLWAGQGADGVKYFH